MGVNMNVVGSFRSWDLAPAFAAITVLRFLQQRVKEQAGSWQRYRDSNRVAVMSVGAASLLFGAA